ncbi:MAG: UDP-glucose/GDP-mannose dehydrogenase family protein [Myxococcota bacterium]|nr:UDP-glucose/GDP-mannose dehydrogenase family protein [Myxococcota bacterium]
MQISIVGTGYVGLVTGTCFANTGNDVVCLDLDEAKIHELREGRSPIYEPGLDELIERNTRSERLSFTTDPSEAHSSAEIFFICVGTPSDEQGRADLQYVLAAAREIGDAIEQRPDTPAGETPPIVVVKSTVPVGTNQRVKEAVAARTSKRFATASNPEFLKEGDAIHDFYKPDRVVVGVDDVSVGETMRELYKPYLRRGNPLLIMDIPSAEMVKYAANAMLATKISFINEIANLSEAYGAEIEQVRRGMCSDKRIGDQFFYPGLGYGGSCFPKDVLACISMGEESDTSVQLLSAVHDVNQRQRRTFTAKLDKHFGGALAGRNITVWGLSFKPRTDDVREAPALTIVEWLLEQGARVTVYDPVAMDTAKVELGDRVIYASAAMEALDGAAALVICTEWSEFRMPDLQEVKTRMAAPTVFDGRNIFDPQQMAALGFAYYSVGRRPVGR